MRHAASYLLFKRNYAKMTDSERYFLMNRIVHVLEGELTENVLYRSHILTMYLLRHLRVPIQYIDEVWWMRLRPLTEAPLFSVVLRQL